MRRHFVSALLAFLAVTGAARAQTPPPPQQPLHVMMCELHDESGTGWVPEFLMMTRHAAGPETTRIEVYDPILQQLVRRPIKAVITQDGARSRSYGWALAGVKNRSGQYAARMDFRLTVRKSDGVAQMVVTAEGYDNQMLGQGNCASGES